MFSHLNITFTLESAGWKHFLLELFVTTNWISCLWLSESVSDLSPLISCPSSLVSVLDSLSAVVSLLPGLFVCSVLFLPTSAPGGHESRLIANNPLTWQSIYACRAAECEAVGEGALKFDLLRSSGRFLFFLLSPINILIEFDWFYSHEFLY